MPKGWYKSLWEFNSKTIYVLDMTEDYVDLTLLQEKDMYLMQAFDDSRYKSSDLKYLNFVRKCIQVVVLADITTVKVPRISQQVFEAQAGNFNIILIGCVS